jgi:hypothetical protein
MLEFLWRFNELRVQTQQGELSDVMVSVKYRLCCTDRHRSVYRYGEIDFAAADPDVFTQFDEVTEDGMIAFVEQTLGSDLDVLKDEMLAEHSAAPVENRPLPWMDPGAAGAYAEIRDSAFPGGRP